MRTVRLLLCAAVLVVIPIGCGGDPSQENAEGVQVHRPQAGGLHSGQQVSTLTTCDPGFTLCGDQCVNLNKNFDNCGACGNSCQPSPVFSPSNVWRCFQGECECITCRQ